MAEPPSKKARSAADSAPAADEPLVEIRETASAGRGLFTTRAVAAGVTVASEVPTLRWVDAALQESVCGWCLCHTAAGLTDTCKGCARVRWCSAACRDAHAAEHDAACELLVPLGKQPPPSPEVDALHGYVVAHAWQPPARSHLARWRWSPAGATDTLPLVLYVAFWRPRLAAGLAGLMQSGKTEAVAAIDSLCFDVALSAEEEACCKEVHSLLPTAAAMPLERIQKLHRQDKANSFLLPLPAAAAGQETGAPPLPDPATGRAVAIYPTLLAMANHSCWPTAVRVDPSLSSSGSGEMEAAARLSYRALEALPAGTEVTQSYVGVGWPQRPEEGEMSAEDQARFVPRKDYLKGEYGFSCECLRCKIEDALPDSDDEGDEEEEDEDEEVDLEEEEAKEAALEKLQEQVRAAVVPLIVCSGRHLSRAGMLVLTYVLFARLPRARTWSCSCG